jgi:protein TonB
MRAALLILTLLSAVVAAPAHAQLGAPILRGQPTAAELRAVYPPRAAAQHLGGMVNLGCDVGVSGHLERCVVISETPPGYGFGAAALSLSGKFVMEPKMQQGRAVPGGRVRLPIVFSLPDQARRI